MFYRAPSGVIPVTVVYSPDGKQLTAAFTDGKVRVFDLASRVELHQLDCPERQGGFSTSSGMLAYDPGGRWIAACSYPGDRVPGEVRVFDATTGRRVLTLSGHT